MEFDAFHHWLILRPLIVFIVALPLLIAILLGDRRQRRREKEGSEDRFLHEPCPSQGAGVKPQAAKAAVPPVAPDHVDQPLETAPAAVAMPREWDSGPLRPNWNRQIRLGGERSGGSLR
jgi:hypothetical protein